MEGQSSLKKQAKFILRILQSLMPNEHPASHFNNHGMWVDFQSISTSDSIGLPH